MLFDELTHFSSFLILLRAMSKSFRKESLTYFSVATLAEISKSAVK